MRANRMMTKMHRNSSSLSQDQSTSGRVASRSNNSQRPPTRFREQHHRGVSGNRALSNEMSRDQAENEACKTDGSEEDANYNKPNQFGNQLHELPEPHNPSQSLYHQQHQQNHHPHQNLIRHNHHHQHNQHAPTCLASKLVNVELSSAEANAHYIDQPQCFHSDSARPRPTRLLQQHHKPTCVLHKSQVSPNGGRRMFKSLINQPHVQLSSSTSSIKVAALRHQQHNSTNHDTKRLGNLRQISHHRNRQIKHLARPVVDINNPRYLLLDEHHPNHLQRPRPSGLLYADNSRENRDNYTGVDRANLRTFVRRPGPSSNDEDEAQHSTQQTKLAISQSNEQRTTIKFISQLYFLLHLSAMISLLMHHKNLVSDEQRALMHPMTMQITNVDLQQQHFHMRRNSSPPKEEVGGHNVERRHWQTAGSGTLLLVNNQNRNHNQSKVRPPPTLPVPQMFRMFNFNQSNPADQEAGAMNAASGKRSVRSSFGTSELDSNRLTDSRSSDILVRLVGRLHAKCALLYFLSYLLVSSVVVLLLSWLVRICDAKKKRATSCLVSSTMVTTSDQRNRFRAGATRRDCTPVLIGSISLGLIQLIVIGLEIADSVDWLTTSVAGRSAPVGNGGELCRWPTVLPLLQFIFVSLLMQFILAMVARNRRGGLVEKPPSKRRNFSNSSSLQNIALAHLLVTHILLWLMKLNSISLFQPPPSATLASFVLLPQPSLTMHNFGSSSTATSTTTSTTTPQPPSPSSQQPTTISPSANSTPLPSDRSLANQKLGGELEEKRLSTTRNGREQQPARAIGSSDRASERNFVSATNVQQRPDGGAKTERDLRSAAERRPLSPVRTTTSTTTSTLAPVFHFSQPPQAQTPTTNSPSTDRAQQNVRSPATSASPGLVWPHQPPPITFKSSLPKRMTAFRHSQPSTRLNVAMFSTPTKSPTLTLSSATTRLEPPTTTTTPRPIESRARNGRHKVRIIVHRDENFPSNSIDLSAVFPIGNRTGSSDNEDDDHESLKADDEPKDAPANGLELDQPVRTTERPFPSVDDDPPDSRQTTARSSSISETRAPKSQADSNSSSTPDIRQALTLNNKIVGPRKMDSTENEPSESDEDEENQDESEVDLDALLPPIPNYNNDTTEAEGDSERSVQTARQTRQMARGGNNETRLLDENAFAFNEAASSSILSLTTGTMRRPNEAPLLSQVRSEALERNHELNAASHQRQQYQQQAPQQPTFTEFLLPIVQQYHILVLTILFNMWLDSMQRQVASENSNDLSGRADFGLARPRHLADGDSSSSSELSPTCSSNERFDSTSLSLGSSTRHLVDALELARRRGGQRTQREAELREQELRRLKAAMELTPNSSNPRRRNGLRSEIPLDCSPNSQLDHKQQEISSSACSIFFGLLVVSGSLIVILIGVDLLSLLVQCSIQMLSILFCLVGLCFVWRLERRHSKRQQLPTTTTSRSVDTFEPVHLNVQAKHQIAPISHKSSFHYLFLLAAYYCGISIALNLDHQHQIQRLFPAQVIQFIQRWLTPTTNNTQGQASGPVQMIALNCQLLFYCAISLKGLILIVQVTVQTILIRSSWSWPSARAKLRQIYTFLMFTNLSLWALEICDQQQQMQLIRLTQQQSTSTFAGLDASGQLELSNSMSSSELLTLEGFTRFAGSVVTLSHLYHGLVFMQH